MKNIKKQSIYATAALTFLVTAGMSVNASAEEVSEIEVPALESNTLLNTKTVLDVQLASSDMHVGDLVIVDVIMDNISNIAAEDLVVKYDSSKLGFSGHYRVSDGLVPAGMKASEGQVRYIIASRGEANVINGRKVLLRMYFTAKEAGEAKIGVCNVKVSDGIDMEKSLKEEECGNISVNILES